MSSFNLSLFHSDLIRARPNPCSQIHLQQIELKTGRKCTRFIILHPQALFTHSKRLASGMYFQQNENESNKAVLHLSGGHTSTPTI